MKMKYIIPLGLIATIGWTYLALHGGLVEIALAAASAAATGLAAVFTYREAR